MDLEVSLAQTWGEEKFKLFEIPRKPNDEPPYKVGETVYKWDVPYEVSNVESDYDENWKPVWKVWGTKK